MLTKQQQILLARFIGRKSIFDQYFMESKLLTPGSKIHSLEMAIQLPTKELLPFLDTLFATLKSEQKSAYIIVHGLKFIHDLYHNNPMKTGKNCLEHFFGSRNTIIPELFQKAILRRIKGKKTQISESDEMEFMTLENFCASDHSSIKDESWRSGIMSPPEELLLHILTDRRMTSVFNPGSGINDTIKPDTKIPTLKSASTQSRKYDNRFLIEISKQLVASTAQTQEAPSLSL